MQALIPQPLKIKNDSVPEDEAPLWDEGKDYVKGEQVIFDHYVYEAQAESKGRTPADNSDAADAPWITVKVTNKYAGIDPYNYTQTVAHGQTTLFIQVPFAPPSTGVALLEMGAVRVTVSVHNQDGELVYGGEPVNLLRDSRDYWDYCFGEFRFQRELVLTCIPPVSGTLSITLERGDSPAIGNIIVGEHIVFGVTQYGVRSGFTDYSKVTVDDFGRYSWVKRGKAREGEFPVWIDRDDLDYVQDVLTDLAGAPALWIGDNGAGFRSMIIHGFLEEYEAGLGDYGRATANYVIRGTV